MDISHTGYFYFFLQLATQHFVAVAGFKTGVLHVKSFLQLVSQQKVARKIASCNMAFRNRRTKVAPPQNFKHALTQNDLNKRQKKIYLSKGNIQFGLQTCVCCTNG